MRLATLLALDTFYPVLDQLGATFAEKAEAFSFNQEEIGSVLRADLSFATSNGVHPKTASGKPQNDLIFVTGILRDGTCADEHSPI